MYINVSKPEKAQRTLQAQVGTESPGIVLHWKSSAGEGTDRSPPGVSWALKRTPQGSLAPGGGQ